MDNSKNSSNTAEDLSKMSKEDLEQKIDELVKDKKYTEMSKYMEELSKRENIPPTNIPEKSTKEKMEELLNKKVLKKSDKEELKKLLEQHQRERETSKKKEIDAKDEELKDKINKPNTAAINDLYTKLLGYDNPAEFKKIEGTAKRGFLPFIPNYRGTSDERRKQLKAQGISTFDIGKFELLNVKRRTIRGRMNRTAAYLNKLSDKDIDTQKAMDYIFSMTRKRNGGKIGAGLYRGLSRGMKKIGLENTKQEFDKELETQKKIFLNSITSGEEQDEEKQVMEQIKQRIDFYINNYKLMQAKKRLA